MATIYKVTAHFRRVVQPASYESAEASLTVEVGFDETEYAEGNALKLLAETKASVLKTLNLVPAKDVAKVETAATEEGPKPVVAKARKTKPNVEDGSAAVEKPAESDKPAETKIADEDLQKAASVAANKVGATLVKNVMKDYGVARLGDVKQEDRQKFLDALKELKKPKDDDEIPM